MCVISLDTIDKTNRELSCKTSKEVQLADVFPGYFRVSISKDGETYSRTFSDKEIESAFGKAIRQCE